MGHEHASLRSRAIAPDASQEALPEPTGTPGKRTLTMALQFLEDPALPLAPSAGDRHAPGTGGAATGEVHAAARHGITGPSEPLPHLDRIQRLFGRHDVRGIQAHVGGAAAQATRAMGAQAYATGDQVAFGSLPDLHTAAHEAAHVIQQRGGVQLQGGIGAAGDRYERHADAVADRIVRGESAEGLLDEMAGGRQGSPALQHKLNWTDGTLCNSPIPRPSGQPPMTVDTGGTFEEFRNILDALRRYKAVTDDGHIKGERRYLIEIARWSRLQIANHPTELRNQVIARLVTDVDHELKAPRQIDVVQDVTYHLSYKMLSAEAEASSGKCFLVTLPSGFDPAWQPQIAQQLGAQLPDLDFINRQDDVVPYAKNGIDHQPSLSRDRKVNRARQLVTQYLHSLGLTAIVEQDIAKLIANQKVDFLNTQELRLALHGSPGGSAESTEGITTPGKPGERKVLINTDNHTLNAIVHELFHSVESSALHDLPNGLVEGMTEYFALHAAGLTFRRSIQSPTPVYADNMKLLRLALDKGAVSHDLLVRGYFLGEVKPLARLSEGWSLFSRLSEQISFGTTGKAPTPEDRARVWKQVEDAL